MCPLVNVLESGCLGQLDSQPKVALFGIGVPIGELLARKSGVSDASTVLFSPRQYRPSVHAPARKCGFQGIPMTVACTSCFERPSMPRNRSVCTFSQPPISEEATLVAVQMR